MTMLNVMERLTLLKILPQENNFATLKLIRDLGSKIGLDADELKKFDVKQLEDGNITWNKEGLKESDIEFKEKESEIVADALKKLDSEKKLSQVHVSLYEKFVTN